MKTQNYSIAKSSNTTDSKNSALALNADLPSLRGTVSAANTMNVTSNKALATSTGKGACQLAFHCPFCQLRRNKCCFRNIAQQPLCQTF
jgi:hypothetical protein